MDQMVPLYIKVKDQILDMIKSLEPHTRIPSRTFLVSNFKVTRTTIDRAISELIGQGILYAKDGSGTYVSEKISQVSLTELKSANNWAVILPSIMHDTYPGILRGVEDVASEHDINVMICNTDNYTQKQSDYIDKIIKSGIKGVIIVPAIIGDHSSVPFQKLHKEQTPFVFCNRGVEGVKAPRVISNSFYGGYIATKHLIEQGYHRIAYLSRPLYSMSSERYQGYFSAISEAGRVVDQNHVIFEESFELDMPGYDSARKLLATDPVPDAIFCFNDSLAYGTYQAINELGLTIGKDIGLIGYDNTHICDSFPVRLTSVRFKTYEIGKEAAEQLLGRLNNRNKGASETTIFQPELVVRESSQKVLLSTS